MTLPVEYSEWKEVREAVLKTNPVLAKIIDHLAPGKAYPLVKVEYRFGDLMIENGILNLPTEGGDLLPITHQAVDDRLRKALLYHSIPLSLLLNKSCEVFVNSGERAIPLNLLSAGNLFGTFETVDFIFNRYSLPKWSVSAGARTLFTLSKITDDMGMKRLRREFDISSDIRLKHLSDHWKIFREITKHPHFNPPWKITVLYFTSSWFNHKEDIAWLKFYNHIFKEAWEQSQYIVEKTAFAFEWQKFIHAISYRNLKPKPYLVDTVKHLFLLVSQSAPGIIPGYHSDIAPVNELKTALTDVYLLKKYLPTLMYIAPLNTLTEGNAIYYSLSFPTLLEGSPIAGKAKTIITDLRNVKLLIDTLKRSENSIMQDIDLSFFHVDDDPYKEILSSRIIPELDSRFDQDHAGFPDRNFCASSPFWCGCIKLFRKNVKLS